MLFYYPKSRRSVSKGGWIPGQARDDTKNTLQTEHKKNAPVGNPYATRNNTRDPGRLPLGDTPKETFIRTHRTILQRHHFQYIHCPMQRMPNEPMLSNQTLVYNSLQHCYIDSYLYIDHMPISTLHSQ